LSNNKELWGQRAIHAPHPKHLSALTINFTNVALPNNLWAGVILEGLCAMEIRELRNLHFQSNKNISSVLIIRKNQINK
jgi:hypothetical protein